MSHCKKTTEGDEYACSCGLRWGRDEEDPHDAAKRISGFRFVLPSGEVSHYSFPESLSDSMLRNLLFYNLVRASMRDGDEYVEMLEKVVGGLLDHIESWGSTQVDGVALAKRNREHIRKLKELIK